MTFEFLLAEVLELGGNVARDNDRKRVTPFHFWYAISLDSELDEFFRIIGFHKYRFPLEELVKKRGVLNAYLYYHTKDGNIYRMKKEELVQKYNNYL